MELGEGKWERGERERSNRKSRLQFEHQKLFFCVSFNDCLIERSIYVFYLKMSLDKMHKQS